APRRRSLRRVKDRRDLCERRIGIRAHELRKRRLAGHPRRQDNGCGAGRCKLLAVLGAREERDGPGSCRLERCDVRDAYRPVTVDDSADQLRKFGKGRRHGRPAVGGDGGGSARSGGTLFCRYLSASALITFSVMSIFWLAKTTGSCSIR